MLRNENPMNPKWNSENIDCFSSEVISINPLLKMDKEYPLIFSASNNFSKKSTSKQKTNRIAIQLSDTRTLSAACNVKIFMVDS